MQKCLKYIYFILLLTFGNYCRAQVCTFKFYLTKACSGEEVLDTNYSLSLVGSPDMYFVPKGGIVDLPDTGKYTILTTSGPILDDRDIHIQDFGLFVFRYKEANLQLCYENSIDMPPLYKTCGTYANGYQADFYPNGNLKIRGNFQDGFPKDSLIEFYPTGRIKRSEIILPERITTKKYDTSGNLLSEYCTQRGSLITYCGYSSTLFFPDGRIEKRESSVNHIFRMEEYYPSGQLKTRITKSKSTEYDEKGAVAISYKWKRKRDGIGGKVIRVHKKVFTQSGQLLEAITFEDWCDYCLQPDLDVSKWSWVIRAVKYKAGKEIFRIENIDPEKYIKEYGAD